MITFFHTADLHFGVENYGRMNSEVGIHSRLLDFKKSFDECVQKAIEENIDFFLFCGDAYKTAYPTPTQQKLLMDGLFKLQKAKIPVVIIVGNHDHPLSYGKANALDVFADLPIDGFHIFSKPELFILETKNGPVQILGVPWPTRNNLIAREEHRQKKTSEVTEYLSAKVGEIIDVLASKINTEIPAILAGHLTVSNGVFSGSEKRAVFGSDPTLLPSQLALPQLDYVALGHLHRHQNLNSSGYPAIVYSGSFDRVDFGERKEKKGFCRVSVDNKLKKDKRATFEFVEISTRPFLQIEVKLESGIDFTQQIIDEIKKHDIVNSFVKIIYYLPDGKHDKVDLNALHRECSSAMQVAGIIPVQSIVKREKRLNLKVDMDFISLVDNYLESKEEYKENKLQLLEKAKFLHSEIGVDKN